MGNRTIELLPAKEPVSLTPPEWNVIAMFHKYPDLKTIAQKFNINEQQLDTILERLETRKLIRVINLDSDDTAVEIPSFFWERLEKELSKSIGPIAALVIDDKLKEFNRQKTNFPHKMLYSLVEKVATEISVGPERNKFQKTMLELIKQYL